MRYTQTLDGVWQKRIGGGAPKSQTVPYSALCCGDTELTTAFALLGAERASLRFEGITYRATVWLNGVVLGEMPPYCRCEFDITAAARPGENRLRVDLRDMGMAFGPSEGWENYGGIIRSVYVDYTPRPHIADIYFRAQPDGTLGRATCRATVSAECADGLTAVLSLVDHLGDQVAAGSATVSGGAAEVEFALAKPRLWSPDDPYLYTLNARLGDDEVAIRVGVKDFHIEGRQFVLNGRPLFLRGVCRHDLWGDQGHTLTRDQMRKDMRMIKATGANFVRLVHYPHDGHIVELADEIGLLVSEEPGLWWSDMHNPAVVSGALEVMERTVLRDRSHVSIAFWLAFNECVFTEEFLLAAGALCRRLDPTRPVSGANCMDLEMTRALFSKCGFDFYTYHPYGNSETQLSGQLSFDGIMEALCDKPLVFTEWGGFPTEENHYLFERFLKVLMRAGRAQSGPHMLAGCSYWVWADMYEFQRGEPACLEGRLYEGLVDIYRNPRANYHDFSRALATLHYDEAPPCALDAADIDAPPARYAPIDLFAAADESAQAAAFARLIEESTPVEGYHHKRRRRLTHGPALPHALTAIGSLPVAIRAGAPYVVADSARLAIGRCARRLYLVAAVMPWGYPCYGERGEVAGAYQVVYEDGGRLVVPLENGVNLATALAAIGPSRIVPTASDCRTAFRLTYDLNWEHYAAQLYAIDTDPDRPISRLEIRYEKRGALLLYGITAMA
ncbi:MAG: hypothetical protein GX558_12075 [Clostridiales bacterium]|nr:hypothetical protein [Clostridiales bacterium]